MIRKNPAGIPIEGKQVEDVVERIIDYVTNLRSHVLANLDKKIQEAKESGSAIVGGPYVYTAMSVSQLTKLKYDLTVGAFNSMSMRQALLSVTYPYLSGRDLNQTGFNRSKIFTGIVIPITIKTKNKNITVDTKVYLRASKRKKAPRGFKTVGTRNIFYADAEAQSPILEIKSGGEIVGTLKDYLKGKPLQDSYITIGISSEVKYRDAVQQIIDEPKTTREKLRRLVTHEITHAADPLINFDMPVSSGVYARDEEWEKYYNVPTEWRARVNEYMSRVRARPQDFNDFDEFLKTSVYPTASWSYLTKENKRNFLAALYGEWERIKSKAPALTEFQRRKKEKSQSPLNIFRYLGAILDGRYVHSSRVETAELPPQVEVFAAQVEDKPKEERKTSRTRKPTDFNRRFTGVGGDERFFLHTDAELIAKHIQRKIDIHGFKNRKYIIEIGSEQEPDGEGWSYGKNPDEMRVTAGRLATALEKIDWKVGNKRILFIFEVSKNYYGEETEDYFRSFHIVRKS